MLTEQELNLCKKLGECASDYADVLSDGMGYKGLSPVQRQDVVEFVTHIHDLQHAVMARAAIRAHPKEFRE